MLNCFMYKYGKILEIVLSYLTCMSSFIENCLTLMN